MKEKLHGKTAFFKIFIISLSLFLPLSALAESPTPPAPFSGFYLSGDVGLEMPYISTNGNLINSVPAAIFLNFRGKRNMTANSLSGGARFGYNLLSKRCLLGLAADAHFVSSNMRFTGGVVEVNSDFNLNTNSLVKLTNQFSLLCKFGSMVGNRSLLYGLIGPRWGKISFDYKASYRQNIGQMLESSVVKQESIYQNGLLIGLGTEFLLVRCLSLGFEFTHTFYGTPELADQESLVTADGVVVPGSAFRLVNSFKAQNNNFAARISVYF